MSFKKTIPNTAALRSLISEHISSITSAVRAEVGTLEKEYINFRRYHRVTVLVIALAFLLPNLAVFLLGIYLTELPNTLRYIIGVVAALLTLSMCGYYGGKLILSGYEMIKQFHKSIDKIAYSKVFDLLGVEGKLVTHSVRISEKLLDETASKWSQLFEIIISHYHSQKVTDEARQVFAALTTSELITEPYNVTQIDTVFEVTVGGVPLTITELDIKQVEGSGRKKQETPLFKGYFAAYPLKRASKGKTFVSTEGDLYGFAHRTYWEGVASGDVKEVIVGNKTFEDLLFVATTDEAEAKAIISQEFMEDLYAWWQKQNTNIRISFIGDTMYILFPDERIRFEDTVDSIDDKEVEEYLVTIAEPLLNILHLVEDVEV